MTSLPDLCGGATEAVRAVRSASLPELANALYPELDATTWFSCPGCQRRRPRQRLNTDQPAASPEDELCWRCTKCGRRGTRFWLERLVLEDGDALRRLFEAMAVPDWPWTR